MDDWSALELEGDDEELDNLFGNRSSLQPSKVSTALHPRPSSQCSVLQPLHNTTFCANPACAPAATSATERSPVTMHANSRKRVAASFGPSPNRSAGQSLLDDLTDTAYDELELDSCSALTDANPTTRLRGTHGSQNTFVRHNLPQHSAKAHGINIPSQTTEQWLGLPEPLPHRSQPNVQRPAPTPAVSNSARTNAMHLRALHADENTLPGPAGVLQRAQASGMQMPQLVSLTGQSMHSASQWQQQQHSLHPDFLSPAWQSAMEAMGLSCFNESSLMLQHHVKNIMLCPASCKLPKAILLIESLAYTGSGSAFAQLKDPTGSIGAGIHADVFQAEEGVSLGAVLMLQQVPLLVLSKNTRYLCMTAGNIMQQHLSDAEEALASLPANAIISAAIMDSGVMILRQLD